jgi:hypothetical protein
MNKSIRILESSFLMKVGSSRCDDPARVQRAVGSASSAPERRGAAAARQPYLPRVVSQNYSLCRRQLSVLALLLVASALSAAELTLKVVDQAPPKALDAAISATLQKKAIQLLDGDKPVYEFWFVSELPLTSKPASPAKALDSAKQATLLGAVSVPKAMKDYRDDELAAGVYTMRFALQPQDGNHLGSAEFTYFAVLVPAKLDTKPGGISDYKPLVKASSKETATDHPVILSLRPASSTDGDLPKLNEPAPEHKSVRVRVPAKAGEEKTSVVFEVVYEGKGHK